MKKTVKVSKSRVKMPETFQEMLEINRQFFLNADEDQVSKYADVLSALRGPDNQNYKAKLAATCPIRRVFLGDKYHESNQRNWELVDQDNEVLLKIRKRLKESHFSRHAAFAFDALGLKWDEVNDLTKESK